MIISSHVGAGALVGLASRRPVPALAAGFLSHLVMDAMPHWGTGPNTEAEWLPIAKRDGITGLAAMAALTSAAPPEVRLAVLAGMTGACLPDTDKVGRFFVGHSPWPTRFDRFHEAIQNEARDRLPREVATAAALTAIGLVTLRALSVRTAARRRSAADAATPSGVASAGTARSATRAVGSYGTDATGRHAGADAGGGAPLSR
jgi:hypothetical protein